MYPRRTRRAERSGRRPNPKTARGAVMDHPPGWPRHAPLGWGRKPVLHGPYRSRPVSCTPLGSYECQPSWGASIVARRQPPNACDIFSEDCLTQEIEAHGLAFGGGCPDDRLSGVTAWGRTATPSKDTCRDPPLVRRPRGCGAVYGGDVGGSLAQGRVTVWGPLVRVYPRG